MDEFVKKIFLAGLAALFIFALAFGLWVASGIIYNFKSLDISSNRTISVSGEGKAVAIPDIAQFTFQVISQGGTDLGKLQENNTQKANAVIDFLKKEGVESKDISTQSYNVEPRYQYFSCPRDGGSCPPPEIVGYTVTQSVKVKVRDFSKIGNFLSGAAEKGANSVSSLSFTVDDPAKLQNEAKAQAVAKAREAAQSLARAGGFKLKRIFSISESPIYYPSPRPYELGLDRAVSSKALETLPSPAIEPGSQDITVTITITYEIE